MIKIGTVNGDVIEAGGVKNVTNNYYGEQEAKASDETDEELLNKIHVYFKDEDTARRFLEQIQALESDETRIDLVKRYRDNRLCLNTSKSLWKALCDMGLYGKSYANWNRLMNKK